MAHNVFISWSKDRAKAVAEKLTAFLPDVIQAAKPWFSPDDISKGKQWRNEIHKALDQIKLAIVVITPESQNERWIHYEAGIMAASLNNPETLICPYLVDLEPKDLLSPLADLNVTLANHDDTLKMVTALARALDPDLEIGRLERQFNRVWPDFENDVKAIEVKRDKAKGAAPARNDNDVLNELVQLVRDLHKKSAAPQSLYRIPIERLQAYLQMMPFRERHMFIAELKHAGLIDLTTAGHMTTLADLASEPDDDPKVSAADPNSVTPVAKAMWGAEAKAARRRRGLFGDGMDPEKVQR